MKKFILPLVLLASLTSCSVKPELRKDIKAFIANFSLEESVKEYQTGGYIQTTVEVGEKSTTKEIVEMSYSLIDSEHPTYQETTTKYVNDKLKSTVEVVFVQNESGCYISTNGELKESSVKECKKLITKFFYKQTSVDGQYHTQGWYYGDYLKEVAPVLQKYVTIDQEQELYIYEYTVTEKKSGVETKIHQNYKVNKLGMLEENHYSMENETKTKTIDIIVHK